MKLIIPRDMFDNSTPPAVYLCTTGGKIIGQLPTYDVNGTFKWGTYSELTFSIDRCYVDVLTGEYKVNPLFDKAEGLRCVKVGNIGMFIIQDPDNTYSDKDSKTLVCHSLEYTTASKYLEEWRINTGDVDSKEVIYAEKYSLTYDPNNPYKTASEAFDPYTRYYEKTYSDSDSYTYTETQVRDAEDYNNRIDTLFVRSYENVQFYNPNKKELSLLHLIFEKIPEWSIGNVDATLWHKERKFDEDRIAVYDFLMNDVQDTFNVVVEWDTLNRKVHFYEEAEDGITDDNTIQTRWESDVFVSKENLASEIKISSSVDDIKTKLKVSGSDDLNIREVNLGKNYLLNLDYYHNLDWMEQDLFEAYKDYLDTCEEYADEYTESMQGWVAAYNRWNDLMNAVPAEAGVVLIGDVFEKLYCVYEPFDTAYYNSTLTASIIDSTVDTLYSDAECTKEIDKTTLAKNKTFIVQGYHFTYDKSNSNFKCKGTALSIKKNTLLEKLKLYHVNEDTKANQPDNVLLKLRNSSSDVATIRIYNKGTETSPTYSIQSVVVNASTGISEAADEYTVNQWIQGTLTAEKMDLEGFTVTYIGTMGAYFVLAKDETEEANLEEYGVNLLKEKHDTYVTIFQTQTEAMFSQEKYQCIAQDDEPDGDYDVGTRWLDTNSNPVALKEYNGSKWVSINAEMSKVDQKNYENYQRYIDNYNKMIAVQKVLLEKETEAEYCLNGYSVPDRKIVLNPTDGQSLEGNMQRVAIQHFNGYTVTRKDIDTKLPLYIFTTSKYPDETFAVYLKGATPYVAFEKSQGVYQAKMDSISQLTDLEEFFTKDQWVRLSPFIREDEFNDDNFLLTGYESEEERIKICRELMESADKELKTLAQPSLKFSMTMANILALPEFEPLIDQFQLGNFVRVYVRDGYVKRARLLEVSMSFEDLSDFSCTFGNLITTKSEIDKHAELLKQAVSAGKQVASAAGDWQMAVDKSNKLEEAIEDGLKDAALSVGKASGQAITWDSQGIRCRKYKDGSTTEYENEQIAIINNKLVFTNDNWETSKAALGEFTIELEEGNPQTMYGLLADAVVGGYLQGATIKGGTLEIGGSKGKFIVSEDGSVQILGPDQTTPVYATKDSVDMVSQARKYYTELVYNGSTVFSEPNSSCTITCKVYSWDEDITSKLPSGTTFSWIRNSSIDDTAWNDAHANRTTNTITITNDDIEKNASFSCEVNFDDSQINS